MNSTQLQPNSNDFAKVFMLGGFSVLLCLSIFMSIFAPYPLGLATLVHGRIKGLIAIGFAAILGFSIIGFAVSDVDLYFIYLSTFCISLIIALGLAEVVRRQLNPFLGILIIGAIVSIGSASGLYSYLSNADKTLTSIVTEEVEKRKKVFDDIRKEQGKSGEAVPFEMEAMLAQPELVAEAFVKQAPAMFLVWIFFMLWVNMFLMLKSRRLMSAETKFNYSELDILNFKMPDKAVWFVIGLFVVGTFGDQIHPVLVTVGITLLHVFGVFYFFQGFGIYLAFLDFVRLRGFLRTMLIVLTVFSAGQILAVIGLADMFIDFRKFMKKNDSGE